MPQVVSHIRWKGSRQQLEAVIRRIPAYIANTTPDVYGIGRNFKVIYGHALLTKVHQAYLIKSTGAADELGNRWKPLTRQTIAQRPIARGEIGKLGLGGRGQKAFALRTRGLLTPAQDKRWRGIFASTFHRLMRKGESEGKAKILAAKIAWAILKSQGAQTKLAILGSRHVPIMIDTERLIDSLTPGTLSKDGTYNKPREQIFETKVGTIALGSKVPYYKYVSKTRPIFPSRNKMNKWHIFATQLARNSIITKLEELAR